MRRILAISSLVSKGAVGLNGLMAPLTHAGLEVLALPTVVLSNHPGHTRCAGTGVEAAVLADMLEALDANGWLAGLDAIVTSYLPTAEHVAFAEHAVQRVRKASPEALYVLDPVLGDDPKGLYIAAAAATALRAHLVPLADVMTPNRFELSWLSGQPVASAADAVKASRHVNALAAIYATSIPAEPRGLDNVLTSRSGIFSARVSQRAAAPHGTGDLFTGFVLRGLLEDNPPALVLGRAVAGVAHALDVSAGANELALAAMDWSALPAPAGVSRMG